MAQERSRGWRRLVIAMVIVCGVAVGLGVGGLSSLTGALWPFTFLLLLVALHSIGRLTGRMHGAWHVWPFLGLAVATLVVLFLPKDLAPYAMGLAVALWFCALIAAGILEVVLDPEGRLG